MGSSPCSHDNDPDPSPVGGVKGSDLPIVSLDKNNPSLWGGTSPSEDNPYVNQTTPRKDVMEQFEDDGDDQDR